MKVLLFLSLCVAFALARKPPRKPNCVFSCKGKPNGDYEDDCSGPCARTYFTCWNGQAEERQCPAGLVFSKGDCIDFEWCVPEPVCTFDCKGLPNGDYADPCLPACSSSYYTCWNNVAEPQICRRGEAFDESVGACVDKEWCKPRKPAPRKPTPRKPKRPTPRKPKRPRKPKPPVCTFDCKGLPNGDYADPCLPPCSNSYYTCWNNVAEPQKCRRGDVFDESVGACVDKQWCKPRKPRPPKCSFDCKGLPNGDYADPCLPACSNSYYTCWNGVAEPQKCRRGEAFDESVGACVDKEWCKPRKPRPPKCSFDCVGLPNGDYADPCLPACSRTYYTCWNYVREPQSCRKGDVFDESVGACVDREWCKPDKKATTPPPPPLDCSFLPDGVYADPEAPCSERYFQCWRGQLEEFACDQGLAFDIISESCLDAEWVDACTPPKPTPGSCEGLPDGNYGNECEKEYFICWEGNLSKGTCPRGEAFDGVGSCVDCQWLDDCLWKGFTCE